MTPADVGDLLKRILGAFPSQRMKMTKEDLMAMTVAYTAGLIDLEYELAREAVDRCNKTCEFIPQISRIRAEAVEIQLGNRRRGAEAWGDVLRAVGTFGRDRSPRFRDPLVALAVEAVGWRSICMSSEDDPAPRSKFADAYDALALRERKVSAIAAGATPPPLIGSDGDPLVLEGGRTGEQRSLAELVKLPGGRR